MNHYKVLKGKKILVIDDNEFIRDTFPLILEHYGCEVVALGSVEEGLKELEYNKFETIITDCQLPGMDGIDFLDHIKLSHPNVIKIFISGFANHYFRSVCTRMKKFNL